MNRHHFFNRSKFFMKSHRLHHVLLGVTVFISFVAHSQNKTPQLGKDPIADIVKAMTLEEKVKLVVGKGLAIPGVKLGGATDETPDKVKGISGHSVAIPRLGIPSLQ